LRVPLHRIRKGFTLIELLVVITILGILSSIVFAALNRARQRANVLNTKSTVAKLHSQIQAKWDSYRTRKVPIDPQALLSSGSPPIQAANAVAFVNNLWVNRGSKPPPPIPPTAPTPGVVYDPMGMTAADPRYPSLLQVAAVKLMAIRELQRYEMPSGFDDFAVVTGSAGPPYLMRTPLVLSSPPSIAYTYLNKLNSSSASTIAQLLTNDAAECLYMVVTSGLEDVSFGGEVSIPKSVGDADGDGLPEFQDAWPLATQQFPVQGPQRQPIGWIRWPAGFRNSGIPGVNQGANPFVSDLDPDPTLVYPPPPPGPGPYCYTFSIGNHDYFDTLKVDVPPQAGPARGYAMTPLVFSIGPDGISGLSSANPPMLDPYDITSGAPSVQGWQDNIHNHLIEAR
jgi:prepilin-type N-terminal cleavage/methylation domain-containing protein